MKTPKEQEIEELACTLTFAQGKGEPHAVIKTNKALDFDKAFALHIDRKVSKWMSDRPQKQVHHHLAGFVEKLLKKALERGDIQFADDSEPDVEADFVRTTGIQHDDPIDTLDHIQN